MRLARAWSILPWFARGGLRHRDESAQPFRRMKTSFARDSLDDQWALYISVGRRAGWWCSGEGQAHGPRTTVVKSDPRVGPICPFGSEKAKEEEVLRRQGEGYLHEDRRCTVRPKM